MDKDEALKLENQICFPLYAASRMLTRAYQPLLAKLNITYPQYLVLMVLWEKDGITVNDITQKLYLNTNTITPLLQRMEKSDILQRKRSKKDERQVLVHLTEKGNQMKEMAYCIPEEIFTKMQIPLEEMFKMKEMLNSLIDHLKENT